ncbi:365_t:CDS:2 [Entrophospora sp. SA101]|nr:365_t:CDS:2 [Entrophospora sp. SA101]
MSWIGAGIKSSQFARIASIAGHLWIKMRSKNRTKLDLLKAQLRVLSTLAVKLLSFFDFKCKTRIAILWCRLTEEESLGVFQEAALVAEINDDLEEFVGLPDDSNIEYEDQQLLLNDLMDLTNPEFGNEDKDSNSEENEENDDNDTDSNNEYDEFDEDEFGAVFLQSLQNE